MDMQFTLKEIENTYDDAKNYVEVYQNAAYVFTPRDDRLVELGEPGTLHFNMTYEILMRVVPGPHFQKLFSKTATKLLGDQLQVVSARNQASMILC